MRPVPKLLTPPAVLPVALEEIKDLLNYDDANTDDDARIQALIAAATSMLDGYSGMLRRCIINQTWRLNFPVWPFRGVALPFSNVSSATVSYVDADGDVQAVDESQFELFDNASTYEQCIRWKSGFSIPVTATDRQDAVRIDFVTGYGAAPGDVPAGIRLAISMMVGRWLENPEGLLIGASSGGAVPDMLEPILDPFRRVRV